GGGAGGGMGERGGGRGSQPHPGAMCGAGCHRLAAIGARLGFEDRAAYWTKAADPIGKAVLERSWNEERQAFTAAFGTHELDASLLLLPDLGLIDPEDPRFPSTGRPTQP